MFHRRFRVLLLAGILGLALSLPAGALTHREALKLFDRMAEKLCLSTEQRSEVFFLLLRHAGEVRARLSAEEAAAQALREAVTQPEYDEALIVQRAAEKADAERETALLAGKLFASIWQKLDLKQQGIVRAYLRSSQMPRHDFLRGVEGFAESSDLYLTVKSQAPAR